MGNARIRKIAFNPDCVPMAVNEPMQLAAQGLRMQPNPTTGSVTVSAGVPIQSVVIYNLLGQVVVQRAGSGKQQQQVDVSTLPPGMYIVRVNVVWTARLVKE
ncbi:MAG: T9SS type A sorting domain-containing protein [Flavipsychrobacter sp.]|nr:T9SS type A sorting domain-containing protein [Flavipsychrobacter sp.]